VSLSRSTRVGLAAGLVVLGLGAALALAPHAHRVRGQAVLLATGDVWGEVEPCG
jgi:hypothetical protein